MTKYLYSRDDVKKLVDELKSDGIRCAVLLAVAVAVAVTTCGVVTDENAMLLKTVNVLVSSVCLCTVVYFILNRILPKRARKNYVEKMQRSTKKTVRCKVMETGKKITAIKYIDLLELVVLSEEGKTQVLYWDLANGEQHFVGHIVEFYVVNNKIIGYGESK